LVGYEMHNNKQHMVSSSQVNPNDVQFTLNLFLITFVDCASNITIENMQPFDVPFEVDVDETCLTKMHLKELKKQGLA
jgi:hypothetical protein